MFDMGLFRVETVWLGIRYKHFHYYLGLKLLANDELAGEPPNY